MPSTARTHLRCAISYVIPTHEEPVLYIYQSALYLHYIYYIWLLSSERVGVHISWPIQRNGLHLVPPLWLELTLLPVWDKLAQELLWLKLAQRPL